jgi:hypothetical protein
MDAPKAMIAALRGVVHQNLKPSAAHDLLQSLKHRLRRPLVRPTGGRNEFRQPWAVRG